MTDSYLFVAQCFFIKLLSHVPCLLVLAALPTVMVQGYGMLHTLF